MIVYTVSCQAAATNSTSTVERPHREGARAQGSPSSASLASKPAGVPSSSVGVPAKTVPVPVRTGAPTTNVAGTSNIKSRPARSAFNASAPHSSQQEKSAESAEEEKDDASAEAGRPRNPLFHPLHFQPQAQVNAEKSVESDDEASPAHAPSSGIIVNSGVLRHPTASNRTLPVTAAASAAHANATHTNKIVGSLAD